jgi:pimeloyl-ACP methyl ester carboxylesterase
MGGSIASQYTATFPERVGRLAMLESIEFTGPTDPAPKRAADWIAAVRATRGRPARVFATLEEAAERIRRLDPRCPPATALALAERSARAVDGGFSFKHDPLHVTPSPFPFDLARSRAFWSAIRCPVLLVQGGETEMAIPLDFADRVACFQSARRAIVAGAGHMLMRHRPAEVAALLVGFLEE